MSLFLGIDCGATNLRFGILSEEGELISSKKLPSPLKYNPEKLPDIVKAQLGGFLGQIEAIGLGVPGPLDLTKGLILPSSNIGNLVSIPIVKKFELVFNLKIYLGRDTNLALLGEAWKGAVVGCKDVVMLTLGSGVGGAMMVEGKLEEGASGKAGEIGHMFLQIPCETSARTDSSSLVSGALAGESHSLQFLPTSSSLPRCGLGHQGCFEALINSAKDLDELGTYLGYGLANIADIFNPQKIIIGGGKVKAGDFLPKAIEIMKEVGVKPNVDEVVVEYAKLGEWSGIYGAARLTNL